MCSFFRQKVACVHIYDLKNKPEKKYFKEIHVIVLLRELFVNSRLI